eukprot:TRINITY_DN6153_c0_g1_i1.p1 TRINITY_DN6153_c0_g1~~TRINITY_DN6153_c0_g1_i1.p1  ORF type:complete len:344 (+),score=56.23 TRINITY_DN6153_c0_g1_i1:67-1098(+)
MTQGGDSYRQAGIRTGGNVLRGATPIRAIATATIPSKFETILHPQDYRESKGFGSTAYRFVNERSDEQPGPGAYHKPATFESQSDSFSKKGCGVGFVSKAKRSSNWSGTSIAPGPGKYDPPPIPTKHTPASTVFAPRVAIPTAKPPTVPGPGQYDPQIYEAINQLKTLQAPSSMFQSKSRRGISTQQSSSGPAPGSYDVPVAIEREFTKPKHTAAFSSKTARVGAGVPADIPGPADYDAQTHPEANPRHREPNQSSMFSDSNQDRWGRMLQPVKPQDELPGPGTYQIEAQRTRKQLIASSYFMSGTERKLIPDDMQRLPGPGTYRPRLADKKSFHLNATRKWM